MAKGIHFPSEAEKLERDVAEFRGASAEVRLEALFELSDLCERLLEASPCRERQLELLEARERAGRDRFRDWIRSHAREQSKPDASR